MQQSAPPTDLTQFGEYPPPNPALTDTQWERDRSDSSADLASAVWRYRWAVILPGILGAVLGFIVYLQMPDTFRSATRLIVESDRSPVLDQMTGELVGSVPSVEIVQSQLFSDDVLDTAWDDPNMQPFHDLFEGGFEEFKEFVIVDEALQLEAEFEDLNTGQSLVVVLQFDSGNQELSENAVKSFSEALQSFYNSRHSESQNELYNYMVRSVESLHPEMQKLRDDYSQFRKNAPLSWDGQGMAINPHRERQMFHIQRQSELQEELRRFQVEFAAASKVKEQTQDAEVALLVVSNLLQKSFTLPDQQFRMQRVLGEEDTELGMVNIRRELVPLMVEVSQMTAEFGAEHPKVRTLVSQLDRLKSELQDIVREQTQRVGELLESDEKRQRDAAEALDAIVEGLNTQMQMLHRQIQELDVQIGQERIAAKQLVDYELQHESKMALIDQQQELIDLVRENMSKVELTGDEDSGTQIFELTAPSEAYLVSPILWKTCGAGTLLGLLLGGGLAFLLEKNANTFRDPEEIAETVGAPVLTHLPFFKGRTRKSRKGEEDPFEGLDPHLAVIHAPASVAAEAMRSCRTSVFFETAAIKGGKIIQVTSPLPGDGKSTIAGNLACSIAQSGKSTIVLDCDLRRPQLTDNFHMGESTGVTNVLDGNCELSDAIHDTPLATLKLMPSGPIPSNPAEALTLPDMSELLETLRQKFDYVVVDSPPLLLVTDPSILASYVDGVVLAVKVRRKSKPNAREATKILNGVGANILGVVVNNSDESGKSDGYRGHGYYRYGRQASRYRNSYRSYGGGSYGGYGGAYYGRSRYYSRGSGSEPLVISGRSGTSLRPVKNSPGIVVEPERNGHSTSDDA